MAPSLLPALAGCRHAFVNKTRSDDQPLSTEIRVFLGERNEDRQKTDAAHAQHPVLPEYSVEIRNSVEFMINVLRASKKDTVEITSCVDNLTQYVPDTGTGILLKRPLSTFFRAVFTFCFAPRLSFFIRAAFVRR